jgi:integrase/recombinase XerD
MKAEHILKEFEEQLIEQRYAPNTIRAYLDYSKLYLQHVQPYESLQDVPLSEIERFVKQKSDQISISYQKGLVGAIKKIHDLVGGQKLELKFLYPKRKFETLPKYFSKDEIKRIFDATPNIKHKAILMIIYSCGLRVSDLINLKMSDIKTHDKLLSIRSTKNSKDRWVTLPDPLIKVLRSYYNEYQPKNYLFENPEGGQYSERSVQLILKRALKNGGIKTAGTVHSLRHSFAIHLLQSGTDLHTVQSLMGHQSIKTTEIYAQMIQSKPTPSPLDFL